MLEMDVVPYLKLSFIVLGSVLHLAFSEVHQPFTVLRWPHTAFFHSDRSCVDAVYINHEPALDSVRGRGGNRTKQLVPKAISSLSLENVNLRQQGC